MTVSSLYPRLYQSKPAFGFVHEHGNSWKNVAGHDHNMRFLRKRHEINRKRIGYKLAGTITICKDLLVKEIREAWRKITRKLRNAGVVAWWIREISRRLNRVHYHLIVASAHDAEELKRLIRATCPQLKFILSFQPIKNAGQWSNYLCKSTEFAGKTSFHAKKVTLFADWVRLEKHGTIGHFWQFKPRKRTPAENQARREHHHRYQEAYADHMVRDAAEHLADVLDVPEHVLRHHYANELATDPNAYQAISDEANQLRGVTPYPSGPFRCTPAPVPLKPPTRRKATNAPRQKLAAVPYDPAASDSITGDELSNGG